MKTFGIDFKNDVGIDRNSLETECEIHPSLYAFYADGYAEARAERDREKDKLDLVMAQRDSVIRKEAADAGMKTTEAVISSMVAQDKEVLEQKDAYRIACAKIYTLDAAMGALDHRKSQLDNLVQLWIKSYYSTKSANADGSEANEKRAKLNYGG